MPEPKRRGRPPKIMAAPTDRLAQLTARERALAIRATARYRYTIDLPLELYEQLLDQAESWGQSLPDVVRGAIRKGLDHIRQFGGAESNPYAYGKLNPPTQADIDPTGLAWPPTPGYVHQTPVSWSDIPHNFPEPKVPKGLLPSGATVNLGADARPHPESNARNVFGEDDEVPPEG